MNDIKFSIIIPVYNAEKYLDACIHSVLNQTYKNFEIILVDDGSKDKSPKMCDEYASKYESIRVIHKENGGEISARIAGGKELSGDYVLYIDSDDEIRNDALAFFSEKINESVCDVLLFEASKEETFTSKYFNLPLIPNKMYSGEDLNDIHKLMLSTTLINSVCTKLIKRDLVLNSFIDFEKYYSVRNGADAMMSFAIVDNAKSVMYTDEVIYYYRTNEQSVSNSYSEPYYASIKAVGTSARKYSEKWYGSIMPFVYERNMLSCNNAIVYELTHKKYSYLYHYKKIKSMLNDDFFVSSYKNSTLKFFSAKKKILLKLIKYMNVVCIPIMCVHDIFRKINSR